MNSQIRTYLFTVSAILLLGGAVLYLTQWFVAPYLFAVGAAGITVCYLTESWLVWTSGRNVCIASMSYQDF